MLWNMEKHHYLWKQKSGCHLFKVIHPHLIVHASPSVVIVLDSQNSVCWKEQRAATGEAVACSLLSTSSALRALCWRTYAVSTSVDWS